jgi:hypothetical protein
MEYYALYCQRSGKPKPGYKAMIILKGLELPVDVYEDDQGVYYFANGKTYRPGAIPEAKIVPIEQALCIQDIEVGDLAIVKGQLTTARKVAKIDNGTVHFSTGTPKTAPLDQVYKKLATISDEVNFLSETIPVDISSIKLFVVSCNMGYTLRPAKFDTPVHPKTERLVAFVTCPVCGTLK